MSTLKRQPDLNAVNVATSAVDSTTIDVSNFVAGSFQLPSASGTTQITIYSKLGGNDWAIAKDEGRADMVFPVVAGSPTPLPIAIHNYPQIRLVASAGTATAGVPVFLKS